MAKTNFTALTSDQKRTWSRDVWKTARQNSFVMQNTGTGPNAVFQRITELTKSERGDKAIITLVPDLEGDGVVGDYQLEDNEEEIKAYDLEIVIDQIRNANRTTGRMADQKTVVNFRETSRDVLGYWLADRIDQMAFLTASGMDFRLNTNGSIRTGFSHDGTSWARTATVGYSLYDLAFASDVSAPTTNRYFRWNGTTGSLDAATDYTALTTADTPSYAMLVEAKAHIKDKRVRSVKAGGGMDVYHVYMHPKALAKLKLDSDFLANVRNAGPRGNSNPLFSGAIVTVDGLVIHENTHVFNTLGATAGTSVNVGDPGYKWGPDADVDGSRILIMGAQALAVGDLGNPYWEEDTFDYGNQHAISLGKIMGFRKPVFHSPMDGGDEDFGILAIDVAI